MVVVGDVISRSVVGQKKDQGVIQLADGFQRPDDLSNSLIHTIDLCGVDRHALVPEFLLL